jgi:hypothetical protein
MRSSCGVARISCEDGNDEKSDLPKFVCVIDIRLGVNEPNIDNTKTFWQVGLFVVPLLAWNPGYATASHNGRIWI